MRLTIVYVCCKFHKKRFYSKKSYGSVMPLCNHVCGLEIFSPSVSTGARGRRRQHRGELTGPGGTLNGVSSPHSAFSKVAGKSFSVFNRFGPNLVHLLGGPRRGPPTNFEENPTTLSGLQRLKAKMTRKHLADGDQIYKIFVSMHYTCFMKIWRQSDENWEAMKNYVVSWRAFPVY